MTLTVTAGLYPHMSSADYFADPCVEPSLTQSIAKILLDKSPRHARLAHPRLNPNYEHTEDTKFNIGNAAHSILIGRGKELHVVAADDWRTKDAKAERDEANAAGKVAILAHQFETATNMAFAAWDQLRDIPDALDAFNAGRGGHGEVVMIAQAGPIWLRSMADWMVSSTRIFDYKTTGASAAPQDLAYRMADGGWELQAAIQERILDILEPDTAGRRKHFNVVQETYEPYALSVMQIPESVMTLGRLKLDAAMSHWAYSLQYDRWPGYARHIQQPSYPKYAEARVMEQLMGESE